MNVVLDLPSACVGRFKESWALRLRNTEKGFIPPVHTVI